MKKVLLLLANGFECYEASVFIDVIGWNMVDGDQTTQLITCGLTKELQSSFGHKVTVDYLLREINIADYDALAVPGGFSEYGFYRDAYHEEFLDLIRGFHARGKIIASICVGALPLGKSGILKGKAATTYNMKDGVRQKTLAEFGAVVKNQPLVYENNIITSWNPSTAMEVAFLLMEILTSRENASYIRTLMGFNC